MTIGSLLLMKLRSYPGAICYCIISLICTYIKRNARVCFPRCNSYGWPIAAHDGTSSIREYADLRVNRSYLEDMADELVARADRAHRKGASTPREVEWGKSSIGKRSRDSEAAVSKGMYNLRRIKKT
jgi:hypothetical protein